MDGKIGVLALQGDVSEHIQAFKQVVLERGLHLPVVEVRLPADMENLIALAIPGGESTTFMRLIDQNGMREKIRNFTGGIFATCAGMVVTAREVRGESRFVPLGIVDTVVNRNAFGRQRESFEADIPVAGISSPFHAVFIRAPVVENAGPGVTPIATLSQGIVGLKSGKHMVLAFHPEIGGDLRLHHLFLDGVILTPPSGA
ncbi:MAG TPA: pyridoxal 5'-phosphate synthase glutaminase subunit PdxT [Methanospirillum sp.]|uniref:pyridoxal 5'-phosphate synthase glutaminase subunit PdxT n=1 Tax=Methanospirillum sp. TaxID=45200 RepID=UPI002B9FD14A|nr:pyridoxal 5'-phosphate synthase glutaminase subunit PdxT [Methanospirillum sp.]HWQ63810.1 pyridoxal 5'-phosphate synthase glutaminase subunit PdxT [Methanospirillum sp.]